MLWLLKWLFIFSLVGLVGYSCRFFAKLDDEQAVLIKQEVNLALDSGETEGLTTHVGELVKADILPNWQGFSRKLRLLIKKMAKFWLEEES